MRLSSRRLSVVSLTAAAAAVMLGLTVTDAFVVGPRQHHEHVTVRNNPSSIRMASTEESSSTQPCAIPSDLDGDGAGDTQVVTVADLRSVSLVNQRNERVSLGDLMGNDDTTSIVVFLRHMA